ncbi:MAG: UvrD-helicase domain-containing protein [Eubacteriales bacterium]|nr:UvrD-helicase domain-containing protein [Christensenellaceae bacterium]MDY3241664.1 UvrD-helicase domain-containing protein [Eubacteriales bacterium]
MADLSLLDNLNEVQKRAVTDTDGALLVLAGAGSGKTRVLTTRVAYLVKVMGVDPYNILAITFTNKAAGEMKQRISQMLGENPDVWISTFHSMCAQILFRECERIGYNKNFSIYSEAESARLLKRIMKAPADGADSDKNAKLFDTYFGHIKKIKGFNRNPEDYAASIGESKIRKETLRLYYLYEEELKKSNAMDFDDLLINTVRLFEECQDVLERYQRRFRYIHVDEFQDTNRIQYRLIKLLAAGSGNIFVVGDEDQSIYGWRGADISNILDFKNDFPDAKVYKLEENYRSTAQILNAANRVISNNKKRFDKILYTSKTGGKRVEVFNAYNDREEVDYVMRNINDLVTLAGMNYGDIAILMRANSLSRQFEEALTLYNMPYRVYGGIRFYERKEIKELLSYLRIALNPKDTDSATRVINVPRRGIGDTTVQKLLDYGDAAGKNFFEVVGDIENNPVVNQAAKQKIAAFGKIWRDIIDASEKTDAPQFAEYVLKASGLLDMYKADDAEPDRVENLKEFVSAVTLFKKDNPGKTIEDFMRMVALISDADEMDGSNSVTLATIHAVKGLEFKVVFIVALEENIFPSSHAVIESDDNIEEERRLMYVAITRAQERLYVSSSRSRFRFNQRQSNLRSRFVAEMIGNVPVKTPTAAQSESKSAGKASVFRPSFTPTAASGDTSGYVVGRKVMHTKFGEGVIVSVNGEGNEKIAGIEFPGLGIKKFVVAVAMANMRLL